MNIPVLVQLNRGEFIWVLRITDNKVFYWSAFAKKKVMKVERFEDEWAGLAIVIENVDNAGEIDIKEKSNKKNKDNLYKYLLTGGFIITITTLCFLSWIYDKNLSFFSKLLLLIINMAGCYICYVLIMQEKQKSNLFSNKFCKVGKYIDCKKVTRSQFSTLFGIFSWIELGSAYFVSTLIWILLAPLSNGWLSILWWLSLLVLPFTLWSLALQVFIIRKGCIFCCAIIFLLWANVVVLLIYSSQPIVISITSAALMVLLFVVCLTAINFICKTIDLKQRLFSEQREVATIKYNSLTINAHFSEAIQPFINTGLIWRNPESTHEIGLYVSITCSLCKETIKELIRVAILYPHFSYRLIFAVNTDNQEDQTINIVVRYLINLSKNMSRNDFFDLLNLWYGTLNEDFKALKTLFPISSDQDSNTEMEALCHFSRQHNDSFIPAILIDGRLLSKLYTYKDLYGILRTFNNEK